MKFLTPERLNLVIALCAVLISGASFYATYLQADAAKKQVRAMTLPLVNFEQGNFDPSENRFQIYFELNNSGVGPALVKTFEIEYKGEKYHSPEAFLFSCCNYREYREAFRTATKNFSEIDSTLELVEGTVVTGSVANTVIPGQSSYSFLTVAYGETNKGLWAKLNKERREVTVRTCYCSMLGECYWSGVENDLTEAEHCPTTP